jgi:glycosyltransferase 2 family protein
LSPAPATRRPYLSRPLILVVAASLLILVLLAYRSRGVTFRWNLLLATVAGADWRWLGASILLILLSNVGRALRWKVMLRPFGNVISVWRLTSDTAIGLTASVLLGRIGEVVRPYLIAVQTGLAFTTQAAAWLLERMLDTLAVLLLCGYALIRLPDYGWLAAGGYALAAVGCICLILLLAFRDPQRRAERRILSAIAFLPREQQDRVAQLFRAFAEGMECTRDWGSLGLLVAYTALEWAVIVAGSYTLLRGFEATKGFGLLDVLVLLAFMTLGSVVQVPGVGGGVQVASVLALTKIYGVGLEAATSIAIMLWIVTYITIVPVGIACAFHEGLNWSKLKLLSGKKILQDSGGGFQS